MKFQYFLEKSLERLREDILSPKIISITLFLCFYFFNFQNLFSEGIVDHLNKGEKFYRERNFRQALGQFKSAIDINSNSSKAHMGYAKSSLALGSLEDSLVSYKKVLENEPKNREAISGLAEVLSLSGNHNEGIELVEAALKEEPYNPILLIQRATILLRMGKSELALRRLEEAKSKVISNYDYNILLSKAYIANKNFAKANEIIEQIKKEYPENAEVFYIKAILHFNLAENSQVLEKQEEEMQNSMELLDTAISLEPDYDDARRLLLKVLVWIGNFETAYSHVLVLKENYKYDVILMHYYAFLCKKLGKTDEMISAYFKLLKSNELDTIGRFSIEEYSAKNLSIMDTLRKNLGNYRFQEYLKSFSDMEFNIAEYHLQRTHFLTPEDRKLHKELTDYHFRSNNKAELLSELLRERQLNPDDIKINNRIENLIKKIQSSLGFMEGYKSNEGVLKDGLRTPPEIYLFDLKPDTFLTDFPQTTEVLTTSLRYALSKKKGVSIIGGEEESEIRESIILMKGKNHFTNAVYYSADILELLNRKRKKDNLIRYIGYGTFNKKNDFISIKYRIYDRSSGMIIKTIKLNSSGRNSLEDLSTRLADEIMKVMPIQGKILKVKKDSVVLNIGYKDGFKKGDLLKVFTNKKAYEDLKITKLDDFILEAEFEKSMDWKKYIGVGQLAVPIQKIKPEAVNE
jgi:thioredoxin-like negative regulator of GroEL